MKFLKLLWKLSISFYIIILICYTCICFYAVMKPKLNISIANSYYLYDKNNNLFSGSNDDWISLEKISADLINATIAIEDKNFYKHQGFDFLRIIKSLYINAINRQNLQGASTITQQYAKNLFLDFGKTWERKIEEAKLTVRLEAHYSKDEILEGYLNTINYGGIFGIENASKYYFNKSASDLTLAEASMLAGIPKWPSRYSPFIDEKAAKDRQYLILEAMVNNNYITKEEMDKAYNEELVYHGKKDSTSLITQKYFEDAVYDELQSIKSIPSSLLKTGGLKIYTTYDYNIQKNMEESMINNLKNNQDIQVASVAMNPSNGEILGLIGGRDYATSQFNRATSAKRPVGSTMKPLLYYAALENGFTASTTFKSAKTTFTFSEDKTYSPQNYGDKYPNKPITMAAAIALSDNIYAVKTHLFLGEDALVDMAKRLGITAKLEPVPSLALGSQDINLIEMLNAYATFANEGYKVTPHLITKVEDMDGNVLYEFNEEPDNILNKSLVYIMNELLTSTYASEFIDYTYPTCAVIAGKMSRKYAVKTGTTDTDHLIFGYNKDLIIGAWIGYDDNKPTIPADGLAIKNMWIDAMENSLKDSKSTWYEMPSNVVGMLVDPISGEPSNSKNKRMFYYIKGTEPYEDYDLDDLLPTIKEVE